MDVRERTSLKEIEPQLRRMKFSGRYNDGMLRFFEGAATLDANTGQFVGTITDPIGIADIIGEKLESRLCFVKLYRERTYNSFPINYEFQEEFLEWKGYYRYGPLEDTTGPAVMQISEGESLMSASEFRQFSKEVTKLIADRREEIAERFRGFREDTRE